MSFRKSCYLVHLLPLLSATCLTASASNEPKYEAPSGIRGEAYEFTCAQPKGATKAHWLLLPTVSFLERSQRYVRDLRSLGVNSELSRLKPKPLKVVISDHDQFAALMPNGSVRFSSHKRPASKFYIPHPVTLTNVVDIVSFNRKVAALKADGTLVTWGHNAHLITEKMEQLKNVKAFAPSNNDCLYIKNDGTVGLQHFSPQRKSAERPTLQLDSELTQLTNITAIVNCNSAYLALQEDGTIHVWSEKRLPPSYLPPKNLKKATAIRGGNNCFFAIHEDGSVTSWGPHALSETETSRLDHTKDLSRSDEWHLALKKNGTVTGWRNGPRYKRAKTVNYGSNHSIDAISTTSNGSVLTLSHPSELPPGLEMTFDGTLRGTPTTAGTYHPTFLVYDNRMQQSIVTLNLHIAPNTNTAPVITATYPDQSKIIEMTENNTTTFGIKAHDQHSEALTYQWALDGNALSEYGPIIDFQAGWGDSGNHILSCTITDDLPANSVRTEWKLKISDIPLKITTPSLPEAFKGRTYTSKLSASHGVEPYSWHIDFPEAHDKELYLPEGIYCTTDGRIEGIPTSPGTHLFSARVKDGAGQQAAKPFKIKVARCDNAVPRFTARHRNELHRLKYGDKKIFRVSALPPEGRAIKFSWDLNGKSTRASFDSYLFDTYKHPMGQHKLTCIVNVPGSSRKVQHTWTILSYGSDPIIADASLPVARKGVPFTHQLQAVAGVPPYQWRTPSQWCEWDTVKAISKAKPINQDIIPNNDASRLAQLKRSGKYTFSSKSIELPNQFTNTIAVISSYNEHLLLNRDGTLTSWDYQGRPRTIPEEAKQNITAISAEHSRHIALQKDGTVVCWDGSYVDKGLLFAPSIKGHIKTILSSTYYFLAVKKDGSVVIWNDKKLCSTPKGLANIKTIAVTEGSYFFAIDEKGDVFTWRESDKETQRLEHLRNINEIIAGFHVCVALQNNGTAHAWTGRKPNMPLKLPAECRQDIAAVIAAHDKIFFKKAAHTILPDGLMLSTNGLLKGTATSTSTNRIELYVQDSAQSTSRCTLPLNIIENHNAPPELLFRIPETPQITTTAGEIISLSISAYDPEEAHLSYIWKLNDRIIGTAKELNLVAEHSMIGSNILQCSVSDDVWKNVELAKWECNVLLPPIQLLSTSIPLAVQGTKYVYQLEATNTAPPVRWKVQPQTNTTHLRTPSRHNTVAPGIYLSSSGLLQGTPTSTGTYETTLLIQDKRAAISTNTITITINPAPYTPTLRSVLPVEKSITISNSKTFSVELTALQNSKVHYIWRFDGKEVGEDSPTFTLRPNNSMRGKKQLSCGFYNRDHETQWHVWTLDIKPPSFNIETETIAVHLNEPCKIELSVIGGHPPYKWRLKSPHVGLIDNIGNSHHPPDLSKISDLVNHNDYFLALNTDGSLLQWRSYDDEPARLPKNLDHVIDIDSAGGTLYSCEQNR